MAFGDTQPVDFNYFLQRKYALLGQQADATTSGAATQALVGAAQANNLGADSRLTDARTAVLPAESASTIGLQGAQTRLVGEQANVVAPESVARIAGLNAGTTGQLLQNKNFQRVNLTGINGGDAGVAQPTIGGAAYTGFRLPLGSGASAPIAPGVTSTATVASPTAQKAGESYSAWVARLRANGY